jgi:hypothetical protein
LAQILALAVLAVELLTPQDEPVAEHIPVVKMMVVEYIPAVLTFVVVDEPAAEHIPVVKMMVVDYIPAVLAFVVVEEVVAFQPLVVLVVLAYAIILP